MWFVFRGEIRGLFKISVEPEEFRRFTTIPSAEILKCESQEVNKNCELKNIVLIYSIVVVHFDVSLQYSSYNYYTNRNCVHYYYGCKIYLYYCICNKFYWKFLHFRAVNKFCDFY